MKVFFIVTAVETSNLTIAMMMDGKQHGLYKAHPYSQEG
jgi:hypothetical protein